MLLRLVGALVLILAGGTFIVTNLQRSETGPTTPAADSLRGRAARVDSYLANYGGWSEDSIKEARRHQLVVAHPSSGKLTRNLVSRVQGVGPGSEPAAERTLVVCYVSIGEDLRSASVTDEAAASDVRFTMDGTGPRVDPRGPDATGRSLSGIDPRGEPSRGGGGYASFYLDDNSVSRDGKGDGLPDRNPLSGAYYVNAGHPKWFDTLDAMKLDSHDGVAGFREILTTDHGRGLGCDGVFLDTVDTAAPNHYTERDNPAATRFEWTAPGLSKLVARLRKAYPGKIIMQNRGLFFFDNRQPQYAFTTRGPIDVLLFESYRLDANPFREYDPYVYADNRFNVAPKLSAEANRADGFRILSLGYAEGPRDRLSNGTLLGTSTVGMETLLEDIRAAESAGFRHYISDTSVTLVNSFVRDHADLHDDTPPAWSSTTNDRAAGWPAIPEEPTPRIGVQEVVPGHGRLTVRWDVALDLNRVGYAVYYQTVPFDFAADPALSGATRMELHPVAPASYRAGTPGSYANEASLTGLEQGQGYYVVVRAFDASPGHNEDANTVVAFARTL